MQEITIQKWIDFYHGKEKSMTKFIALVQKEDPFLLSYTPENLIIEENLPEFGILEEDIKNILFEDVRLNNKLLFLTEETEIYKDMDKINSQIRSSAERVVIDQEDNKGVFKTLMDKIENLKNEKLTDEEKEQKQKIKEITSSKRIGEVEEKLKADLAAEKIVFEKNVERVKRDFYKSLIDAKTRLVIAMFHGVDVSFWREKYEEEFKEVVLTAVVQGEYEIYGYEYPQVIKKLIEHKIIQPRDTFDFSLMRGVEEGRRYPVNIDFDIPKLEKESEEEYKKRKKMKEKELYEKELKKVQSSINRKIRLNKIKIMFGI